MICAWKELLSVIPEWLRKEVAVQDQDSLQEIRMRLGAPVELVSGRNSRWIYRNVCDEDISFCVQTASRYSPWNAESAVHGYITAPGGHRIGMCGMAVCSSGAMIGIRNPSSVCIRVARDFPGIADGISVKKDSLLILGPPGGGKTTLLRDMIRRLSDDGERIAVVDERGELFPGFCFSKGRRTDVLTGCTKSEGIEILLRTMGPSYIAVDEITAKQDADAIMNAAYCGVRLLATAHAVNLLEFKKRLVYKALIDHGVFERAVVLSMDKTWRMERVEK